MCSISNFISVGSLWELCWPKTFLVLFNILTVKVKEMNGVKLKTFFCVLIWFHCFTLWSQMELLARKVTGKRKKLKIWLLSNINSFLLVNFDKVLVTLRTSHFQSVKKQTECFTWICKIIILAKMEIFSKIVCVCVCIHLCLWVWHSD